MELMACYYANWPKWEIPNAMHVWNTYNQKTDIYTKKKHLGDQCYHINKKDTTVEAGATEPLLSLCYIESLRTWKQNPQGFCFILSWMHHTVVADLSVPHP